MRRALNGRLEGHIVACVTVLHAGMCWIIRSMQFWRLRCRSFDQPMLCLYGGCHSRELKMACLLKSGLQESIRHGGDCHFEFWLVHFQYGVCHILAWPTCMAVLWYLTEMALT